MNFDVKKIPYVHDRLYDAVKLIVQLCAKCFEKIGDRKLAVDKVIAARRQSDIDLTYLL